MDNNHISYEPMDVDLSGNSTSKMDISLDSNTDPITMVPVKTEKVDNYITDVIKPEEENIPIATPQSVIVNNSKPKVHRKGIRKYHTTINRQRVEKRSLIDNRFKVILSGLFIIISIATYYVIHFECSDKWNLPYLNEKLSSNIFGQTKAIDAIVETLAMNVSSKILLLYGGTGVGKTFAVSLIFDKLWNSSNIYHYTMPSFANTFSTDFLLGMTMCKTSTIVVDDLTSSDMHIKTHIINAITKSEKRDKNITVILIFNCDNVTGDFVKKCEESFYEQLKNNFDDVKAVKKFIKFDSLTEEHLMKCIEKELGHDKIRELDMDNILKNFNVSLDGCKGVYTKIKFLHLV